MTALNFNAATVPPQEAFDVLPADWYPVMMTSSEMKPTKTPGGAYLLCEYTIIDGKYKGRKLWDRLNLQNANNVAVEIAYKTLSAICHAVGVIQIQDSQQLHGRPMMAKVKVKAAEGNYEASNEISGYKGMEGAVAAAVGGAAPTWAGQPAQAAAPAAAAPAAAAPAQPSAAAPWQNPAQPAAAAPAAAAPAGGATPPWAK